MIFAGQSSKRIEHNLNKVGAERISAALSKRGVSGVEIKDIAKAMTGETRGRAGWSQGKLKNVVEALQDVGVAHAEKSASHMVLQAAKNMEPAPVEEPHMSANQFKARMKEFSRERRAEAETEEREGHLGVLDRMRGSMGRANAPGSLTLPTAEEQEAAEGREVREAREELRRSIELKPEIRITKPKNPFNSGMGFQS